MKKKKIRMKKKMNTAVIAIFCLSGLGILCLVICMFSECRDDYKRFGCKDCFIKWTTGNCTERENEEVEGRTYNYEHFLATIP